MGAKRRVAAVSEEAKKDAFSGVSPWDVLIWKLDSIDRQIQKLDQRVDTLENKLDQRLNGVEQRIGSLESRTSQNYLILQWTAILGFIAVIASIFVAPLFK